MRAYWLAVSSLLVTAPAIAQPDPARLKQCEKTVTAAQKGQTLYDLKVRGGELIVYAGWRFYTLPFDYKEEFARAISCVIVKGDPKMRAEFTIVHWQSGKTFGRFHYGRLQVDDK